jgi:hypothetical protein
MRVAANFDVCVVGMTVDEVVECVAVVVVAVDVRVTGGLDRFMWRLAEITERGDEIEVVEGGDVTCEYDARGDCTTVDELLGVLE